MRVFSFLILILLNSCITKTTKNTRGVLSPAERHFGFLQPSRHYLSNVPDKGTIGICGNTQFNEIKKAINMWGAAINRTYHVIQSCNNHDIEVHNRQDPKTLEAIKKWPHFKKRYDEGKDLAFVVIHEDGFLHFYNTTIKPLSYTTILHETGHLFGLCDQYPESITICARTTAPVKKSVMMNAWKFNSLQQDDIEGLRNLVKDLNKEIYEMDILTEKEIKKYQSGNLHVPNSYRELGKSFPFTPCTKVPGEKSCKASNCLWDPVNTCLSAWFSSCKLASDPNICKQMLGCHWIDEICQSAPMK